MEKTEVTKVPVFAVSLAADWFSSLDLPIQEIEVTAAEADVEKLLERPDEVFPMIVCGAPPEGVSVVEIAQILRMRCPQAAIYFAAPAGARFDRKNLVKNGFTDVFFFPLDRDSAKAAIGDQIARIRKRGRLYRPVKVLDLQPGASLDFDTYVYFPVNGKHVCYSSAGSVLDPERVERLRKHQMSSLFIGEEDLPRFYAYTAETLKKLGADAKISETERAEKLHGSVRDLISGLFTDSATGTDSGKRIVEDCQKIVKNYVTDGKAENWYTRLMSAVGGSTDTYSHAANVSTYASLFGIALGLRGIEDIALAGLLHDIGLARVPPGIAAKDPSEWTVAERKEYEKHPEHSIDMIKDRKLVVSDLVHKVILQHHERFNGAGFPKGLAGNRICVEAQVLAVADRFAEMTDLKEGSARMSPVDAIAELYAEVARAPGHSFVEPDLMKRLLALFPAPAPEDTDEAAPASA